MCSLTLINFSPHSNTKQDSCGLRKMSHNKLCRLQQLRVDYEYYWEDIRVICCSIIPLLPPLLRRLRHHIPASCPSGFGIWKSTVRGPQSCPNMSINTNRLTDSASCIIHMCIVYRTDLDSQNSLNEFLINQHSARSDTNAQCHNRFGHGLCDLCACWSHNQHAHFSLYHVRIACMFLSARF